MSTDINSLARSRAAGISQLAEVFGDRLTQNASICAAHGKGEGFHTVSPADAVLFPGSTEEVARAVSICASYALPVIAYGAGTSLEGGVTAPHGGLCIDLERLDKVIAVHPEDLDCVVQAGVTREALNLHLRDLGLSFPIDPGANATLGGMAATRASGTTAVRYGTMRDNVLALEVVLANGSIIRTGSRARKSAAGYDLTGLFVGSEGTLGIITSVTLRLHGRPEAEAAAVCGFANLEGAVDCVIQTMQMGVPIARIELLDAAQVRACNTYSKLTLDEVPTLFFEFHGTETSVQEQAQLVEALSSANGGGHFAWSTRPEERTQLWKARHNAYHAAQALRPGSELIVTDVCVPISSLAECIVDTQIDIAATGLVAPIVGHVGDGNFHVMLTVDPGSSSEIGRARAFNDRLVERALAMNGTCTGEHGIGIGKREKLILETGAGAVAAMRAVKQALDPQFLFNPSKIFTREPEACEIAAQ